MRKNRYLSAALSKADLQSVASSTRAIMVEMFAMTSVAVLTQISNPVQNINSAKSASPWSFLKTIMRMQQETISMEIVNPHAAGIDVGSRSHWVAIGQQEKDIREFGVYNQHLFELADWLHQNNVKTIAMESTGTYWQNLYAVLLSKGFHVILCNGKYTKNIQGKKTDIKDCQWIQKLHSLGLLNSSFLPDGKTEQLRTYCRHRENLIHSAASTSKKMQKYLQLLNLRLDVVVNDICGLTGLNIIRAICAGETSPEKLSELRHGNCRKSKEELSAANHEYN